MEDRQFSYDKQHFIEVLKRQGIHDRGVLKAMETVPREAFVRSDLAQFAYDDSPLPIEEGQTISQPFIVALMTQAMNLRPTDTVLEIGAGSGYSAAVLSRLVRQVYSIERYQSLARLASQRLRKLGYDNVEIRCGDGSTGWPEKAPFDAVVVTAGGPEAPRSLVEQLNVGGCMVIPVGSSSQTQQLLRIIRSSKDETRVEELCGVRFVPLVGKEGWPESPGKDAQS